MKKHVKPMDYISSKQIDDSFDIFAASILAESFIRVGCNYKTDKERGEMKKPSEQIEDAQHKLHDVILAALAEFSEETGLSVPSARWTVTHAMDASGHTQQVVYHSVCTDLASGAW